MLCHNVGVLSEVKAIGAGGRTIQTTAVTTTPFVIRYTAQDALGNTATPVFRSVSVYDPCPPERYCPDTGMPSPSYMMSYFRVQLPLHGER